MKLQINQQDLKALTDGFSYKIDGDKHEIENGQLIVDLFPNSENFWKAFVTPITSRIDTSIIEHSNKIRARSDISTDIVDLSIIHYSVFLNLVYASKCLSTKQMSYFENFYTHLGSVCDLAEEFITQLYFVTLECEDKETEVLQRLAKKDYLKLAADWYEKHYATSYKHYLSKGKTAPFKIIGRSNILDEYFNKSNEWKNYSEIALQIRTYRNVIVHNSQIGSLTTPKGIYVPKKNKIGNYKKWHQVFKVKDERFLIDFIERESQMHQDITDLKTALNILWAKPLQHFERLFYTENNPTLIEKYNFAFTG